MTKDNDYPRGEQIIINKRGYIIGDLINHGTDGRIYAVNLYDGMNPAVVKYFGCVCGDETYNVALLEIEAAERLKGCPYTVSALGHCVRLLPDAGAEIFIIMDRLKCCCDLSLEPRDAFNMAADICLALNFMRRRSLVHCDIKPSNIFLTADGRWQLGDFGCTQLKGLGIRRGSPAYCSPELGRGGTCDTRSDIYSLGIVMYKLLSGGRFPFCPVSADTMTEAEVEIAVKRRLSGEKIPPISGIDAEINRMLLKMCEFEVSKRPASPKRLSAFFRKKAEALSS